MPLIDAYGHAVPAGSEPLARRSFLDLSSSINAPQVVANETERAQRVSELVAAGHVWPRPMYVDRANAPVGARLEVTYDGSTFRSVARGVDTGWVAALGLSGWAGTPELRRVGGMVHTAGTWQRTGGNVSVPFNGPGLGTLPSGIPAPRQSLWVAAPNNVDVRIGIVIGTDGGMFLRAGYGTAPVFPTDYVISFGNISWPVD